MVNNTLYISIRYAAGKYALNISSEKQYNESINKSETNIWYYTTTKRLEDFNKTKVFKIYDTFKEALEALFSADPECLETYKPPLAFTDEVSEQPTPRRGMVKYGAKKMAKPGEALSGVIKGAAPGFVTVPVFYATDRARTGSAELNECFGPARGDLELGKCEVSIPLSHRVGEIERPKWWKLSFKENQEKHIMILTLNPLTSEAFYGGIKDTVVGSTNKDAFIFIHGYNTSFAEAARRTAQIAHDLAFKGAPIMFSWPSIDELQSYMGDEDNVRWAGLHLEELIRQIVLTSGAKKIHLIAHSMGNRLLSDVLDRVSHTTPESVRLPPFNQVILAAPDINADIFKQQIAPRILSASERITLYASSKDKALAASRKIHGDYPRAGEAGAGLVIVDGIDTVDASDVGTDLLGHGYYAEALSLINDMYQLTENGLPPEKRNLRPKEKDNKKYWALPRTG